jgi:hypothetical protein
MEIRGINPATVFLYINPRLVHRVGNLVIPKTRVGNVSRIAALPYIYQTI